MRVRVTKRAYFLGELRRPGEVFDIADSAPLRPWMVRVSDTTPIRHVGAQGALDDDMRDRYGEVPIARAKVDDEGRADTEYSPIDRQR